MTCCDAAMRIRLPKGIIFTCSPLGPCLSETGPVGQRDRTWDVLPTSQGPRVSSTYRVGSSPRVTLCNQEHRGECRVLTQA